MSDTPRTDKVDYDLHCEIIERSAKGAPLSEIIESTADRIMEHARQLERELKESSASHGKTLLMCENRIKELEAQLAMANDAAEKGEKGRILGTAFDELMKEHVELRRQYGLD